MQSNKTLWSLCYFPRKERQHVQTFPARGMFAVCRFNFCRHKNWFNLTVSLPAFKLDSRLQISTSPLDLIGIHFQVIILKGQLHSLSFRQKHSNFPFPPAHVFFLQRPESCSTYRTFRRCHLHSRHPHHTPTTEQCTSGCCMQTETRNMCCSLQKKKKFSK